MFVKLTSLPLVSLVVSVVVSVVLSVVVTVSVVWSIISVSVTMSDAGLGTWFQGLISHSSVEIPSVSVIVVPLLVLVLAVVLGGRVVGGIGQFVLSVVVAVSVVWSIGCGLGFKG